MKSFLRNSIFSFFAIGLLHGFGFGQALENVDVQFCDTDKVIDKTINYKAESGQPVEMCYRITNNANEEQTVKIGFVDGVFTNDQRKNRACQNDGNIKNFGQYVSGFTTNVTIPANSTEEQTATLRLPTDKEGIVRGCLVYAIVKSDNSSAQGTSFSIQIRKSKFIDVTIGDHLSANGKLNTSELRSNLTFGKFDQNDGQNIASNPNIRIYQDPADNKYVVQIKLVNAGETDEEVNITGVVQDLLNYKETFVLSRKVPRDGYLLVTQKLTGNPLINLGAELNISHVQMIDPTTKGEQGVLSISASAMLFDKVSMLILFSIGGALLIIILFIVTHMIKKHKKSGEVSIQYPSQATPQYTQAVPQQPLQ